MRPWPARRRWPAVVLAAGGCVLALAGCTSSPSNPAPARTADPAVVVASFNFGESELIAEIYAQTLEAAGIPVRRELDLGPRELVRPATQEGLVDVVPEYLGTALAGETSSAAVTGASPATMLTRLRAALGRWHLTALAPAAAQDQNAFAVTAATARRLDLRDLSDLATAAPHLAIGGASECPARPLCLPGLQDVYGLRFRSFIPFDDLGQRTEALLQGVIDVEVTFSTDPRTADGSLVVLRDDRGLQPPESVVPVVSERALRRYGARLWAALDAVSAHLDSRALTFLNWRVSTAGDGVRSEARGWLHRHGLLG